MKRPVAALLSLLVLWLQAIVMAQPARGETPRATSCCSCKTAKCCVGRSVPAESAPQPAAPVASVQLVQNLFALTASPAWLLPLGEAEAFSAASASLLAAAQVPLFTRDCALLI